MLSNLPDLIIDIPEAAVWLGNFIGRAVADDCLPPKFVTNPENAAELNPNALTALKRADTLLSLKQGWAHLDNIWGSAGPHRPVKNITKQMTLLLKEYLSSRDFAEAQHCLRALEVPHYHHELVYEAIVMALESVSQLTEEAMCTLLKLMDECCLVTPNAMETVSERVSRAPASVDANRSLVPLVRRAFNVCSTTWRTSFWTFRSRTSCSIASSSAAAAPVSYLRRPSRTCRPGNLFRLERNNRAKWRRAPSTGEHLSQLISQQ